MKINFKKIRNKIYTINMRKYLPINYTNNDIWIVSFPKSGNTWLRFLISNAIKSHYGIKREVNFFTIQDIIPGIGFTNNIPNNGPFGIEEIPRILTSHSPFNPYFSRVIYLVRDPVSVMNSYFNHNIANNNISENISFSYFIKSKKYGIHNWVNHTESWIELDGQLSGNRRIILIKYENLISDTIKEVQRILQCLGINCSEKEIDFAIQSSNKENMYDTEQQHLKTSLKQTEKKPFVSMNRSKEYIKDCDIEFIYSKTFAINEILGYN